MGFKLADWILMGLALVVVVLFFTYVARGGAPNYPEAWNASPYEANPTATDSVGQGDDHMRTLKQEIRDRARVEHDWGSDNQDATTDNQNDGRHREGSARVFFETTAPTDATALAERDRSGSRTLDDGRVFIDSDTTPVNHLWVWDDSGGGAWEEVDGLLGADRTTLSGHTTSITNLQTEVDEGQKAVRVGLSGVDDIDTGTDCVTGATAVNWDTESFDDDTMHDNVTNNERLTTPTGATRVRVWANIVTDAATTLTYGSYSIRQDGTTVVATSNAVSNASATNVIPVFTIDTGPITVTGGTTYFEVIMEPNGCAHQADSMEDVQTDSWFSMEVIQ